MGLEIEAIAEAQCVNEFVGPIVAVVEDENLIRSVQWSVKETPNNIPVELVEFSAPNNLETLVRFPELGKYVFCVECCEEVPCNPLINQSEGKVVNMYCTGEGDLICGQALGFNASEVWQSDVTIFYDGISFTQPVEASGDFCIAGLGIADGTQIEVVVSGTDHNGCSVNATTSFLMDSTTPCIQDTNPLCWSYGINVSFVACNQVCGTVSGYVVGDTVEMTVNGNVYSTVIFPDPSPDSVPLMKPIWCIDLSDDDWIAAAGQTQIIEVTDGTCTTVYPYVHY